MNKKEFVEVSVNFKTYRILAELPGELSYLQIGDRISSQTLYERGYNILWLISDQYIRNINEPYDWQKDLVGKNDHTVHSWCPECQSFGVNMPLDNKCGRCGYAKCITYY